MKVKEYECSRVGNTGCQRHSVTKGGGACVRVRANTMYVHVSQKINPLLQPDRLITI